MTPEYTTERRIRTKEKGEEATWIAATCRVGLAPELISQSAKEAEGTSSPTGLGLVSYRLGAEVEAEQTNGMPKRDRARVKPVSNGNGRVRGAAGVCRGGHRPPCAPGVVTS